MISGSKLELHDRSIIQAVLRRTKQTDNHSREVLKKISISDEIGKYKASMNESKTERVN